MALENITLKTIPDEGCLRNGWQIISPSKSFSIYAATPSEKSEWMSHIAKCVQDLLKKDGRKSALADPSPVWVPDSDAPVCMHCRKSEFTVLNRRHHCRRCGIVCCNACASKRWLLPHQSSKPLRVCLTCFYKLSGTPSTDLSNEWAGRSNYKSANSSGEDSSESDSEAQPIGNQIAEQPTFYWSRNCTRMLKVLTSSLQNAWKSLISYTSSDAWLALLIWVWTFRPTDSLNILLNTAVDIIRLHIVLWPHFVKTYRCILHDISIWYFENYYHDLAIVMIIFSKRLNLML